MTIKVRAYQHKDRASTTTLWQEAFPTDPAWNEPGLVIDRKTKIQPELFLVAVDEESISGHIVAGTVVAGYDGFRGWLHHVAVRGNYQGHGVARLLIEDALKRLTNMGCPKVNLQVRASNREVRGFYQELGFVEEDRLNFGIHLAH